MQEYQNGTDPRVSDSDADLMPDDWEVANSLNPTNANDAAEDADNDGLDNSEEFSAGTNPHIEDTDNDGHPLPAVCMTFGSPVIYWMALFPCRAICRQVTAVLLNIPTIRQVKPASIVSM